MPSRETIARAQFGDAEARNEIILEYLPLIRDIANRYARNTVPADDLQSEGVLALLTAIGSFDASRFGDFRPYLYGVLRQRFISVIRSQDRFHRRWEGSADLELISDRPEPLDSDEHPAGDYTLALESLALLPMHKQMLIKSHFGIDCERVPSHILAEQLGVSASTVRMRVRRSLKELRKIARERKSPSRSDNINHFSE